MPATYSFDAPLWEWESKASWFFVNLPEPAADDTPLHWARVFRRLPIG